MEMESFMDDLLNFSVPEEEEEDEAQPPRNITRRKTGIRQTDPLGLFNHGDHGVVEEEDLEWISNKDAFPVIETFVGVLPLSEHFGVTSPEREAIEGKQRSPVSVLETSSNSSTTTTTSNSSGGSTAVTTTTTSMLMSCCVSFKAPAKARSKRRRTGRRDLRVLWTGNEIQKKKTISAAVIIGRKCQHCGAEKTPQWRAGPLGPKTLCNACGVRYKSGRLVPEYRPANSPTFTAELHSNSHRKIVEMRKQYQSGDGDHRKVCG
ncbi:PREDICTED: GATA transcription factor 1-like isoform X1 [Camelina sativa]|uniref:GATA transcription factor 1-like isoform X1 n=1 Tax=Camelina sativa TaxID=90675 RepID=A0ABM0XNF2_CAMSA|nr:PREDICTED: GATA transcription factor 1-like isoform X1 [Camelina sativa]